MSLVLVSGAIGLALGFSHWNFITPPRWAGFDNYTALFGDRRFWKALRNTSVIVGVTVPLKVMLGLGLALLLSKLRHFATFFRLAIFFPVTASVVSAGFVWTNLYQPSGLLNRILSGLGLDTVAWLSADHALTSVNLMIVLNGAGYVALLYLAGLHSVPVEYYEAARIDGASDWQVFRHITLPLLTPTTFFVIITGVIAAVQTFGEVYIIDGPIDSTLTIAGYIYERAFTAFEMGYASALSGTLIVILLIATGAQLWFQKRWVIYDL